MFCSVGFCLSVCTIEYSMLVIWAPFRVFEPNDVFLFLTSGLSPRSLALLVESTSWFSVNVKR